MRRATEGDAKAITELTCYCFGDAYTSVDEVLSYIVDDSNRLFVCEDDKGLAAAILFLGEDKERYLREMEVEETDYERICRGRRGLHHKFSVIREDLRGMGLMSGMLGEAIANIEAEDKYGAVFTQGWIQPDGTIPMEGIFERMGYVKYKRQKSPWFKYKNRTCVLCGGRCRCDSMVYYRILQ